MMKARPRLARRGPLPFGMSALVCAMLLLCPGAAFAEPVTASVGTHPGYFRLLFEGQKPLGFDARIENGVLVIEFDEAVELDIQRMIRDTQRIAAVVRQDSDGRVLRLALKTRAFLHTSAADNKIAVDIVAPGLKEDPPDLKPKFTDEELAKQEEIKRNAEEAAKSGPVEIQKLAVSVAEQEDYSRVTFEWPEWVEYNAEISNSTAQLTFQKAADPDLVELRTDPPPFVLGAEESINGNVLNVDIRVETNAGLRHFHDGTNIVVDILKPTEFRQKDDAALAQAGAQDASEEVSETRSGDSSSGETPSEESEDTSEQADAIEPEAEEANPDIASAEGPELSDEQAEVRPLPMRKPQVILPKQAAVADAAEDKSPEPEPVEQENTPEETAVDPQPTKETNNAVEQANAPSVATDANPVAAEAVVSDIDTRAYKSALTDQDIASSMVRGGQLNMVPVEVGESLKLIFNWNENVHGAVFTRGQDVWIVFDKPDVAIDISGLSRAHRRFVKSSVSDRQSRARIIRLGLAENNLVTADHKDGAWIVTIGPAIENPALPLSLKRAKDSSGRSTFLVPLVGAGSVHWLKDPNIGDDLAVVTASGPARGLISPMEFVEFRALGSAHGLVVQVLADDVLVELNQDLVQIGREAGLTISQVKDLGKLVDTTPLGALKEPGFIDFENWKVGSDKDIYDIERELQIQLVKAQIDERDVEANQLRLGLAKFYIAHEFAPEAAGILNVLARTDETAELNPTFRALQGVANYMRRRYKEAVDDLSLGALRSDVNASLWRAAALTELGRHQEAGRLFDEGLAVVARYPADWQAKFRLAAARSALDANDLDRVKSNLDAIPENGVSVENLALAEFVRGQMLEQLNKVGEALQHYQRVLQVGKPEIIARANLAKISLLHDVGQISDDEAIGRLDTLRYQWRGDDLELAVLHKLGEFYVDRGDYRHGLNMMKEVVANYSKSPVAGRIAISMVDIFKKLFLEESMDDIPPVQALALYYEFKHLTPIGREGDDMIRKLSDRLVEFDLLEQAAELLEHQIGERLQGIARAQVATRLAVIYLTDHKPEAALQTLRNTKQARLPKEIAYARRILEARALAELDRYEHALEVVEEFNTPEAKQLRADVYWNSQDWDKAGAILENLLDSRWRDETASLSQEERSNVLRTALAYSFADDRAALDRVRRQYGPLMSNSPDAYGFDIVTEQIQVRDGEFAEMASQIATIDTLEAFMNAYRGSLDGEAISSPSEGTAIN